MAEYEQQFTDPALERALRDLGGGLAYPPTPDLGTSVRRRIAAQPARRGRWWLPAPPTWRRFATVLALLLVVALLLGALPPVRKGIARRLGLSNVAIIVVTAVPTPTIVPTLTASPIGTAAATRPPDNRIARAELGAETTLPEAQSRVAFTVGVPDLPDYRTPDAVYIGQPPAGSRVSLVYTARPDLPAIAGTDIGLLIQEFRGGLSAGLFQKGVPTSSRIEPVTINGVPGYWIEGGLRAFAYQDARGNVQFEQTRIAGNTLLWEQGGIVYRLESLLSKDDVLRIAARIPTRTSPTLSP